MYIEYVFNLKLNCSKISNLLQVTEKEYENCYLNQFSNDPLTRRVITCNSPYDVMKYTLNFRSYLPIPNGFEFRPNQTYYFLSTSSSHQQCNKLQILVHDYRKCSSSLFSRFVTRPTTMSMFCLIALVDIYTRRCDCVIRPMKCNQIILDSILLAQARFVLMRKNE